MMLVVATFSAVSRGHLENNSDTIMEPTTKAFFNVLEIVARLFRGCERFMGQMLAVLT